MMDLYLKGWQLSLAPPMDEREEWIFIPELEVYVQ